MTTANGNDQKKTLDDIFFLNSYFINFKPLFYKKYIEAIKNIKQHVIKTNSELSRLKS
jgi:hypothetical protein